MSAHDDDTKLHDDLDAFDQWEREQAGDPETTDDKGVLDSISDGEIQKLDDLEQEFDKDEGESSPAVEETIEEEPLIADQFAALSPDVPINLAAVVAKKRTNLAELMGLRLGGIIDLGRPPSETVDIVANGRLVARGELVEMDGKLGVRILKLIK